KFCVVPSPTAMVVPGCALKAPIVLLPINASDPPTERSAIDVPPEIVALDPFVLTLPSKLIPFQLIVVVPEFTKLNTDPSDSRVRPVLFNVDDVRPETVVLDMSMLFTPAVVAWKPPRFSDTLRAMSPPCWTSMAARSEERRVGKEGRARGSTYEESKDE